MPSVLVIHMIHDTTKIHNDFTINRASFSLKTSEENYGEATQCMKKKKTKYREERTNEKKNESNAYGK